MKTEKSDNEIIAEFMGFTCFETEHDRFYSPPEMPPASPQLWKYHKLDLNHFYPKSWDWLMPVVQKIDGLFEGYGEDEELPEISHRSMCVTRHDISTSIHTVYRDVVEFIKWYNSQKA